MPFDYGIMTAKITVDKAGRVVIPKPLRDQMQLATGDTLELESEGEQIILRPVRPKPVLRKERGIWVYQGEATGVSIVDLIDQSREMRLRELLG